MLGRQREEFDLWSRQNIAIVVIVIFSSLLSYWDASHADLSGAASDALKQLLWSEAVEAASVTRLRLASLACSLRRSCLEHDCI